MLIANSWKYVPAAHGMHAALASAACVPSGQVHVEAPAGEVLSVAQGAQASSVVAPVACEYLPAAQDAQVSSLVAPVACEYLPAVQGLPVTSLVAPLASENLPAVQA